MGHLQPLIWAADPPRNDPKVGPPLEINWVGADRYIVKGKGSLKPCFSSGYCSNLSPEKYVLLSREVLLV
jgi:hypothetical protein